MCFEPRLPRAGGPSLELRPQQEEAQQRRASASCCAASLNLSFLHCKMGTKTPKLAGTCDFSGLTREIDQVRSRSCSEDRDRACAGRADRATCPLESRGAAWARAVWSHPLLAIPPPSPGPRLPPPISERIRIGSCPLPVAQVRKRGVAVTQWGVAVTQPRVAMPEMEPDHVSPGPRPFLRCGVLASREMLRKFGSESTPLPFYTHLIFFHHDFLLGKQFCFTVIRKLHQRGPRFSSPSF